MCNKKNSYYFQGITKRYEPYRDPRCSSIPAAVQSAVSTEILGIVVHTEDLLRDPSQVTDVIINLNLVSPLKANICWLSAKNSHRTQVL